MAGEGGNAHNKRTEAETAELRAEAYRLRLRGLTLRQAAAELGVSHQTVANWSKTEAEELVTPLAAELRQQQLDRLGELRQRALEVLERAHVTVSHGRVIREGQPFVDFDDDGEPVAKIAPGQGEPILDDGPVLAAMDRLLRIEERIAKLAGLDAPVKSDVVMTAEITEAPADAAELLRQARERNAARRAELSGD
ncbi:helix-turn-helix domain-containing protein [Amycolatopsis sp. VC5-11]|uniref:helix-turn-helix domain-containing protein n=1 Tax=Amycolatopsis sp. VC5-11 TaxID=3120156 RepID=UPI003008E349